MNKSVWDVKSIVPKLIRIVFPTEIFEDLVCIHEVVGSIYFDINMGIWESKVDMLMSIINLRKNSHTKLL